MQYMEITDKDDDKAKSKKKKLQKSWKSQQRFAKLDAETQKRQQSWMDFKKGKGSKKKVSISIGFCLDRASVSLHYVVSSVLLSSSNVCVLNVLRIRQNRTRPQLQLSVSGPT